MNKNSIFQKIVAIFAITTLSFSSFGQTLLSEDFESGTFPPSGWTTIDVDGFSELNNWDTLNLTYQYNGIYNALSGDYVVLSRSWDWVLQGYSPDNWLITPQLSVIDTETMLKFYALQTWTSSKI
jgi:hypothetical protein